MLLPLLVEARSDRAMRFAFCRNIIILVLMLFIMTHRRGLLNVGRDTHTGTNEY